jgi:hypothetical protein
MSIMLRNNFIGITALAGLFGFIYTCLLLTCNNGSKEGVFKERSLGVKPLAIRMLSIRGEMLLKRIDPLKKWLNELPAGNQCKTDTPCADSTKRMEELRALYIDVQKRRHQLEEGNLDTSLTYWQNYFSLNSHVLQGTLKSDTEDSSLTIKVLDTLGLFGKEVAINKHDLALAIKSSHYSPTVFFEKYPTFGFWFVFSVAQAVLWLVLIVLLSGGSVELKEKLAVVGFPISLKGLVVKILFASLLIIAFTSFLYFYLIDGYVVKDVYFMSCFSTRMVWYAVPGYLLAGICFGAFLYWAGQLDELNNISSTKNSDITATGNESDKKKYDLLKIGFTRSFGAAALVLSAFVFWLGLLFQAVNSMETMLVYEKLAGKKFLPYDFIYLIGILHTVLLLIFYVPAKLKFESLKTTQDVKSASATANVNTPTLKKFFSAISESFLTIAVAASPMLASLLQKLVESFLK